MPIKDISIPSRTAAKVREPQSAAARAPYVPATSAMAPSSRGRISHAHRFAVGQRLSMTSGSRDIARNGATCSVVFLLPYEGGALRYRVRSDSENFERIVDEGDLSPLPSLDSDGLE
jgi:hypothetical protein